MRGVDVIIFSTGRAASTAVYQYLDAACELNLPKNKEPHYWCDIHKFGGLHSVLKDIHISRSTDYMDIYSRSRIVVDASVGYFFCLDEVIERLKQEGQAPKIVFLYREPVSRAVSLFNEERKKGSTDANNVMADIKRDRDSELWWEHYYDNVLYADCFEKIRSSFDSILAINYDYFSKDPRSTLEEICGFLGLDGINLNEMSYTPVNSSREAVAVSRLRKFRGVGHLVPSFAKSMVFFLVASLGRKRARYIPPGLSRYLPTSIGQYETFREQIGFEDIMCIRK